jgi:hypothetical protein
MAKKKTKETTEQQPAAGTAPAVATTAAPAAPVVAEPTQNGVKRPSVGTVTRSVWDTADSITAASGRAATRAEVVNACSALGVNSSTATTQFGKWAKHHGHVAEKSPGRAEKPAAPATAPAAGAAQVVDYAAEGYKAYQRAAAGATETNPYADGTPEAAGFVSGWNKAHEEATAAAAANPA